MGSGQSKRESSPSSENGTVYIYSIWHHALPPHPFGTPMRFANRVFVKGLFVMTMKPRRSSMGIFTVDVTLQSGQGPRAVILHPSGVRNDMDWMSQTSFFQFTTRNCVLSGGEATTT